MSLEKWVEYGWLKREASSSNEVQGLLSIVKRSLNDAKVTAISADLRLPLPSMPPWLRPPRRCAHPVIVLPAQPGHHLRTIDSLEHTITATSKTVQRLKSFSTKRNKSVYDVAGVISEQDLTEMVKLATELQSQVTAWLEKSHPELLK